MEGLLIIHHTKADMELGYLMSLITSVGLTSSYRRPTSNLLQIGWIAFDAMNLWSKLIMFSMVTEESYVAKCSPRTLGLCKCYAIGEI